MKVAMGLLGLSYPLLIYVGLSEFGAREVALAILVLAAARLALRLRTASASELWAAAAPFAMACVPAALAAWLDDERFILFLPSLVNTALLYGFARTLWRGPPVVERLARLQVGDLSEAEVSYCRTVTRIWCGFFALNGGAALASAVFASLETWAIYNGAVAYLLIAGLYGVEFVYRAWRFRRYEGGLADPVFRRVFPPRQPS